MENETMRKALLTTVLALLAAGPALADHHEASTELLCELDYATGSLVIQSHQLPNGDCAVKGPPEPAPVPPGEIVEEEKRPVVGAGGPAVVGPADPAVPPREEITQRFDAPAPSDVAAGPAGSGLPGPLPLEGTHRSPCDDPGSGCGAGVSVVTVEPPPNL